MAFKERPFINCKAESERNNIHCINLSMSAKKSFSWIAIRNWSQNPRQLMISPSNLQSSNFGNFALTFWTGVILWELPWLEISNELNYGGGGVFFKRTFNDGGGDAFFKHLSIFAKYSKF